MNSYTFCFGTFDGVGKLLRALMASDLGAGVHVGQVHGHSGRHGRQVVQREVGHQRVVLQEQGQGLPDAPSGSSDDHFEVPLETTTLLDTNLPNKAPKLGCPIGTLRNHLIPRNGQG